MRLRQLIFFGVALLAVTISKAQSVISPYSGYGIGDISQISFAHNEAMGGIGVGTPQFYFINNQNPAWLSYNVLSTFQAGIKSDFRTYEAQNVSTSDRSASLSYMSLAFPIMNNKWSTSLGLTPFSSVNYNLVNTQPIEGTQNFSDNEFIGSGGLSQLYWSNGVRITKGINVGFSASYIFGTLEESIRNSILNGADSTLISLYKAEYQNITTYSDFTFLVGIAHRFSPSENNVFNYGITYRLGGTLTGDREINLRRLSSTNVVIQDETISEGISTSTDIPMEIAIGFSYEKPNKLTLGVDGRYASWGNVAGLDQETRNTFSFGAGGSVVPDYKSVQSYFKRVVYRFGLSYNQIPYVINQTEINDFGINFGASFPISGSSSIDSSFKFGLRGVAENNLVRENYFQLVLGLTFNDRWFIKRRYD